MEYLEYFSKIFGSIGGLGFLVGIIILYKIGLLEFLADWKKNGKNGNSLKAEMEDLKENHLHTFGEKLDKLTQKEDEGNLISKEILFILKEIKNK